VKQRAFITLLGGTAAAWPLAARAQQRCTSATRRQRNRPRFPTCGDVKKPTADRSAISIFDVVTRHRRSIARMAD